MKFLSQHFTGVMVLVSVSIFSLVVLVATLILANGNFYIKNLGTSIEQNGKVLNTITVTGDGKVTATPDMATLVLSFNSTADTSAGALQAVNQKVDAAIRILKAASIDDSDIATSGLSIYPDYDYSNQKIRLIGQRANQTLTVKIKHLDGSATKAAKLVDNLSAVDQLQISSISFDIEDKTALFSKAREQAFAKAKQKAEELSKLSNVRLLTPVSITDSAVDVSPPINYYAADAVKVASGTSAQLPSGSMEVTINLSILWGIE